MTFNRTEFKKNMRLKRITQKRLSEIFSTDIRTISRWLDEKMPSLPAEKVKLLSEAIGVDPTEFDPDWEGSSHNANQSRVSARISSASKNGYWLMKKLYGVTEKEILELAPTLFAILVAEMYRKHTDTTEKETLSAVAWALNMPEPEYHLDYHWGQDVAEKEQELLRKFKIFGSPKEYYSDGRPEPGNLFFDTLKWISRKSKTVDFLSEPAPGECPTSRGAAFDIHFINSLTGGDLDLNEAIVNGEIELFNSDLEALTVPKERISWMRATHEKVRKNHEKYWAIRMERYRIENHEWYKRLKKLNSSPDHEQNKYLKKRKFWQIRDKSASTDLNN